MNRLSALLLSILFFSTSTTTAQAVIEWEKSFGGTAKECAFSIQESAEGGYIMVGSSQSKDGDVSGNHGSDDVWVVKLNKEGVIEWEKSLGGSAYDWANAIQPTREGGYIIAGTTESQDGDVTGNHGGSDFWVIKLSAEGVIEWQKCYGGSNFESAYAIQQTSEGGYIVSGKTNSEDGDISHNNGYYDSWIVKLNTEGAIEWQRCYGGSKSETAYSIQQTADGGYIVANYSSSYDGDITERKGMKDYWITKLSPQGELQWQQSYGGSSDDFPTSIQLTRDGGFVVAGYSESQMGEVDHKPYGSNYWVLKLDDEGELAWHRYFGGSGADEAYSIQLTNDGGYILAGYTLAPSSYIGKVNDDVSGFHGNMDYWIVKLSESGDIDWQKCLGGSANDLAFYIQLTRDGGYIVAGCSDSTDDDIGNPRGENDIWIVKLSIESTQDE